MHHLPGGLLCLPVQSQELGRDSRRLAVRRAGQGGRRSLTHQKDRYLFLCAKRNRMMPELQNDLRQDAGVNASDQKVRPPS